MKRLYVIQLFLCLWVPIFSFAQITEIMPSFAKVNALTPVQILGTFNPAGVTTVSLLQNGLPVPAVCTVTSVIPTKVSVNITLPACGQSQGNYYDVVVNNAGTVYAANNSFTPVCPCQAVIVGNIFQDNNNDGIDNGISDPPLGNVLVQAINLTTNTTYVGYTRPNGVAVIAVPIPSTGFADNYTLSVPISNNPSLQNMVLSTPNNAFNFAIRKIKCPYPGAPIIANGNSVFGYFPSPNTTDLSINVGSIIVQPDVRPAGYPSTIPNATTCGMASNSMFGMLTLTYTNNGTIPTAGTIHFTKPPLTGGAYNWHTFSYCYVPMGCTPSTWYTPYSITENGNPVSLTNVSNNTCAGVDYTFATLAPGQSRTMTMIFEPYAEFAQVSGWFWNVNVSANIASVPASIDPTPANNTSTALVCLPYDPNEKIVAPRGTGSQGIIANGQELTYTIHFQNVGSAPAQHVRVEDVLDANLDISTLEVISQSHPVELDVTNDKLTFFFRDIYLPDSMSNPLGSQGFVKFKIHPHNNLAIGTQIHNHAEIYFDFMPAVITNQVTNTIGVPRHPSSGLALIDKTDKVTATLLRNHGVFTPEPEGVESHFSIYPNPAQDEIRIELTEGIKAGSMIEIYDVTGKLVKQILISSDNHETKASVSELDNGLYFCKMKGNQYFSFPLSIQR